MDAAAISSPATTNDGRSGREPGRMTEGAGRDRRADHRLRGRLLGAAGGRAGAVRYLPNAADERGAAAVRAAAGAGPVRGHRDRPEERRRAGLETRPGRRLHRLHRRATATTRSSGSTGTSPTASPAARRRSAAALRHGPRPPRGRAVAAHAGAGGRGRRGPAPGRDLVRRRRRRHRSLRGWQCVALRILGIHGIIAAHLPHLAEEGPAGGPALPPGTQSRTAPAVGGSSVRAPGARSLSARRPAPTARPRPPCWPSGPG